MQQLQALVSPTTPPVPSSLAVPATLSRVIVDLLAYARPFTDIHLESGMPVMLRRGAGCWSEALYRGKPHIAEHEQILRFLNALFLGNEKFAGDPKSKPGWMTDLNARGTLHPAVILSELVDGTWVSHRLRCVLQKQNMGEAIGLMLRPVPEVPASLEGLGLPPQVGHLLHAAHRGLVVVAGPTGSGKSTTLAAMIGELNARRRINIVTVEEPVEFVHLRRKGMVNHREVGVDVRSFAEGVRDALRFVPDVIMLGDIPDAATMLEALHAAEAGHLVLAGVQAPSALGAIRHMAAMMPDQRRKDALAASLMGVLAQQLISGQGAADGHHLAVDFIDCRHPQVKGGIRDGSDLSALEQALLSGSIERAVLMRHSLRRLVEQGLVLPEQAARHALGYA
jgi:Tfp pilus assembly pilus retraction ATPase PilT